MQKIVFEKLRVCKASIRLAQKAKQVPQKYICRIRDHEQSPPLKKYIIPVEFHSQV